MDKIKILLVDDQAIFRQALRTLLSLHDDFLIIGEAGNGEEALAMAQKDCPHVLLMDLRMPVMDGVVATQRVRESFPQARIIIFTTFDDDIGVFEALRAGASGYLLKDGSAETLFSAIRLTAEGKSFLDPSVATKIVSEFSRLLNRQAQLKLPAISSRLSGREIDVLQLIAAGLSNKEIAQKLFLAEGTIKNHITNILQKLGVDGRTQAAIRARDLGLA